MNYFNEATNKFSAIDEKISFLGCKISQNKELGNAIITRLMDIESILTDQQEQIDNLKEKLEKLTRFADSIYDNVQYLKDIMPE